MTVRSLPSNLTASVAPGSSACKAAKIAARNGLKLLSMGMSADFATAIGFGATHVRIGTAIFGARAGNAAGQKKSPDAGLGG